MQKAIFLDKDGTLIKDVPFNVNPELIELEDNCLKGLKLLQEAGFLLIIISNQAGVAHGYFREGDLKAVKSKIKELLSAYSIQLDDFYYCPNHPQGRIQKYRVTCYNRKPEPGMLFEAALAHSIDLSQSWMIGDILHDVEAGNKAGCKSILINNGHETEWLWNEFNRPDYVAKNINQAANHILNLQFKEHNEHRVDKL